MNTEERIVTLVLAAFDRLMDLITLGGWSKHQGEKRIGWFVEVDK